MNSPQHKEECEEIIPREHYRYFSVDALDQKVDHYVLRAANAEKTGNVFKDGDFRINTFLREPKGYGEVAGLSLNLLGGHFTETHLKYVQKGEAAFYWKEGTAVAIKGLIGHISVEEGRIPIYLPLLKLHNLQIPFEKNIMSKQLKKLPPGLAVETEEEGSYQVKATLKIKHAPTNANFWHVEFELSDETRDSEDKVVKKIKSYKADKELRYQTAYTRLVYSLLEEIKFLAKEEINTNLNNIPKSVYTKTD